MKGTIGTSLEEFVTQQFGAKEWRRALRIAGAAESKTYCMLDDVPEGEIQSLLRAISVATYLPLGSVTEAFGEYWSTVYAPRVYAPYYVGVRNARDLLLRMDDIHMELTKSMKSSRPPRFRYEWRGEEHLIMHYESDRGLLGWMEGRIRGVGKYYGQCLTVSTAGNAVHVRFL
jgi:methyl-accepting chemotaxis protein